MSLLLYHVLLARRGQRAEEVCLRCRPSRTPRLCKARRRRVPARGEQVAPRPPRLHARQQLRRAAHTRGAPRTRRGAHAGGRARATGLSLLLALPRRQQPAVDSQTPRRVAPTEARART